MRSIVIALALSLSLAACGVLPKTPAQTVYASKSIFSVGLDATNAYGKLPLCKPAAPAICHEASVLKTVQKSAHVADAALDTAEEVVRDARFGQGAINDALVAAEGAVKAFRSISDQLKVK